ncbi:MAG: hypothetical protein WC686_01575 [Candidatus Shapirobacteria bacterium]|jgi:hypothetical protein
MSQKKIKKLRAVIDSNGQKVGEYRQAETLLMGKSLGVILKENNKFLIGLALGLLALFVNSLNGDFVSDDYATIPHNPLIANLGVGFKGLSSTNILKSMVAFVFGVKPFQYHLVSTIFYIIICVLAFVAIYKIYQDRWLAIMTVLIFSVHPLHVEAVSWISGVPYLFIAFYSLIILLLTIKFFETGRWQLLIGAAGLFLLAYLNDFPRIFAIFPLVIIYLMFRGNKKILSRIWQITPYLVIVFIVALAFGWHHIVGRINVVNTGYNLSDSIYYDPFFQYPTGLAKYLQLFWAPFDLTLYHTMYVLPVWLNWSILLNYLAMTVYFYFKDKRLFFALAFVIVTILPSMAPVKVSWLVAERYAFLPSLGFCVFLAIILKEMWRKAKIVPPTLLVSLMIFFMVRAYLRNDDWATNHKLWVNTCQVSPNSHNAWNNIGDDYDKLATLEKDNNGKMMQYANAIKGFTQSTVIKPNYADAYHNRANIFFKVGRLDLARESYGIALNFSPGLYQTYLSLIQIDLMEGNFALAEEHSKKLLTIQPNNTQAWYAHGLVMAQTGKRSEAVDALKKSLVLDPANKMAAELLGQVEKN